MNTQTWEEPGRAVTDCCAGQWQADCYYVQGVVHSTKLSRLSGQGQVQASLCAFEKNPRISLQAGSNTRASGRAGAHA